MSTITTHMIDQLMQTIDTFFDSITNRRTIDREQLRSILNNRIASFINPNTERFFQAFDQLPDQIDGGYKPLNKRIQISDSVNESLFRSLIPWRKGPFKFSNFAIDSEWQSNMKWDRLSKWIGDDLTDKVVADIGCGSGYYMYRALAHHPRFILGVDPSLLFNFQFHILQHFGTNERAVYLQSRLEDLDVFSYQFDTVISMGVLYHRRDPLTCLSQLKNLLKMGCGTCVLETLIIPGDEDDVLNPNGRYAKMPNVHYIPTLNRLIQDVKKCGFNNCEIIVWTLASKDHLELAIKKIEQELFQTSLE